MLKNGLYLLLRELTERPYNEEAFKTAMRRAWHLIKPMFFQDLSPSIMLAEYNDSRDKALAIREGSWSFNKNLVLLKEVDSTQQTH